MELSIVAVNYNSYAFLETLVTAIRRLTINDFELFIYDNGSGRRDLQKAMRLLMDDRHQYLLARQQRVFGSYSHGQSLDYLMRFVNTPYCAIFDIDCIPLKYGWDHILLNKMEDKGLVVAGTPLALNTPKTDNPKDFPLPFLMMIKMDVFRELGASFMPKNVSRGEDVSYDVRQKYLSNGHRPFILTGKNTRTFKDGPFRDTICDEYYLDEQLFCAHFGRGANPSSGKYSKRQLWKKPFERYLHYKDKKEWLRICDEIITVQRLKHWRNSMELHDVLLSSMEPLEIMNKYGVLLKNATMIIPEDQEEEYRNSEIFQAYEKAWTICLNKIEEKGRLANAAG